MSSAQLYPEIIDNSTLGPKFSTTLFMLIGIEGEMSATGTGTVAQPYVITRPSEANQLFGSASSLASLVKFVLGRGVPQVVAVASSSDTTPILSERQAAWQALESSRNIRLRLTDSTVQADLAALQTSCDNAALLYNKQIAFAGMATGNTKAGLISAAGSINGKRTVLVGPGVYDLSGNLLSGAYAAAAGACEVARNSDLTDDLDLLTLSNLTGIEVGVTGQPLFMRRVVAGSVVNDFEDLLQGGVSPLQSNSAGNGVQFTHLRTTFTTDSTFDALLTRLIDDQVFIDVRDYLEGNRFLRRGNTEATRADIQAGVEALLAERSSWISPVTRADGTQGYNVAVVSSPDNRQVIVSYEGIIVRNIQTIVVAANLSVPV